MALLSIVHCNSLTVYADASDGGSGTEVRRTRVLQTVRHGCARATVCLHRYARTDRRGRVVVGRHVQRLVRALRRLVARRRRLPLRAHAAPG
eukprot:6405784-Prymnesium_polylepis.1